MAKSTPVPGRFLPLDTPSATDTAVPVKEAAKKDGGKKDAAKSDKTKKDNPKTEKKKN